MPRRLRAAPHLYTVHRNAGHSSGRGAVSRGPGRRVIASTASLTGSSTQRRRLTYLCRRSPGK
eukprot:366510-Chlamydomonas_euryale.AAC.9